MISILVATGIFLAAPAPAPALAVKFVEGTFQEALAKGASKKVPIFMDFYTDW